MISICIPVYNFPIADLVETLRRMADRLTVPVEIILIDDDSNPEFISANDAIATIVDKYHLLTQNIGRSKIRNLFLQYARFDYCLFLDCDVMPVQEAFLSTYADKLHLSPTVIYGGRVFPDKAPDESSRLRWKYGTEIESKSASQRKADPYRYFHSNNFLVRKSVLQQVQFDETFTGYGYEDSLFSYQLQRTGIPVSHIDNPVLNLQVESTEKYLENIDDSLTTLAAMQRKYEIGKIVRLARLVNRANWLFSMVPTSCKNQIKTQLIKGNLNLRLLQLYKVLGYSAALKNNPPAN